MFQTRSNDGADSDDLFGSDCRPCGQNQDALGNRLGDRQKKTSLRLVGAIWFHAMDAWIKIAASYDVLGMQHFEQYVAV